MSNDQIRASLDQAGRQITDVSLRLREELRPAGEAIVAELAAAGRSLADAFTEALDHLSIDPEGRAT